MARGRAGYTAFSSCPLISEVRERTKGLDWKLFGLITRILATVILPIVACALQARAICGYADSLPIPMPRAAEQLAKSPPVQPTIQPSQQAFIKWDPIAKVESISVQPVFEGNAKDFGMLVPTPSRPRIDEMPRDLFTDLARYTLLFPAPDPMRSGLERRVALVQRPSAPVAPSAPGGVAMSLPAPQPYVRVLEKGVVGSLDYKILASNNSEMLFGWLKQNKYGFKGDESTLKFYIAKGWVFTVMRIDTKQMRKSADGRYVGEITPTRFTFSCTKCTYPLRITQHSVKDKTKALFYVQAPNEMDLPKHWSWKHSYRPVYLQYRLAGGADARFATELRSRESWLNAKVSEVPSFVPTELEWAKRLTQDDMNILENPSKYYSTMVYPDLPPGAKVLTKPELLADYRASYAKLSGRRNPESDPLYHCFDNYPSETGGFSVRYPDSIVGDDKVFTTHYAFYPDRAYVPAEADSVVRLKGLVQKGQWLTKFSRSFSKLEMNEDMVLDDLITGQEVTYTRLLPNRSHGQWERYLEQKEKASSQQPRESGYMDAAVIAPKSSQAKPSTSSLVTTTITDQQESIGNIAPYRSEIIKKINENWRAVAKPKTPSTIDSTPTVMVVIAKDGALLSIELLESSGNKKTDRRAMDAIESTDFPPLPEWFTGESVKFKIHLQKVLSTQ